MSVSQALFAATLALAMIGTYMGLTPPNDPAQTPEGQPEMPSGGDTIRRFRLTNKHTAKITMLPLVIAALHTSLLALYYKGADDDLPPWLLGHGAANGLNRDLITWSLQTSIPLALILVVGVPLRLISYTSLGANFTFTLTRPDTLSTTGIYRHVQHPSYTGLVVMLVSHAALLARVDGVVACCLVPPEWYPTAKALGIWVAAPAGAAMLMSGVWTRVWQEEKMLREYFGREWEVWHSTTPRFLPSIIRSPVASPIKQP